MLNSYLRSYRWGFLVVAVGVVGCSGGNQVSCPADLQSCPATPPTSGTACQARGSAYLCEYGDDPSYGCNVIAYCDPSSGWIVQPAIGGPGCPTTLSSGCPASFAEAMSGGQSACASTAAGLTCRYPEGTCACASDGTFACTAPAPAGCPATRPLAGSTCAAPCTTWGTGICDGQSMKCLCGTWQPVQCYD